MKILFLVLIFLVSGCFSGPEAIEEEVVVEEEPEEAVEKPVEEEPEEVAEKPVKEEEAENCFYEDSLLRFFGESYEYLLKELGEPKKINQIPGQKEIHYEEAVFYVEDDVVHTIFLKEGKALGIELGMAFEEIKRVLGEPRSEGFDENRGGYLLCFFLGERKDGLAEVEIYIEAEEKTSADAITIIWKKYWW